MKDQKARDGIITLVSITFVNALNYGLNLILGRWLGPEVFAQANILATLVLVLSFVGVSIQLMVANQVARYVGDKDNQDNFYLWIERQVLKFSVVVVILGLISSRLISDFLQLENSREIITITAGIPLYFLMCARRGYYQGDQQFGRFSITFIAETVGRLAVTVVALYLAINYMPQYTVWTIAIGFLASFVIGFAYTLKHISFSLAKISKSYFSKEVMYFVLAISFYELSQILINNCDVILVKHYFDDLSSGLYSSIALIGRIVYFGTWTIVTLLFPKVIEKEKNGESHSGLFYNSLAIVAGCGAIITLGCFWQGELILTILFGSSYIEVHTLLWQYALATTLFATANVFAYYHMSLKNYIPVFITLLAGAGQIILITIMKASLKDVITAQILIMSFLLVSMMIYHIIKSQASKSIPSFKVSEINVS